MSIRGVALLSCIAIAGASVPGTARAGVFLRGAAGWLEGEVYDTPTRGSIFLGGPGASVELGLTLGRWGLLGVEVAPSYSQPRRVLAESIGYENGRERLFLGNLSLRMEPIENLQPYFLVGGGQGIFSFRYTGAGKEIRTGYVVKEETLKAWLGTAGLGFEGPISSHLFWGARGRFLYHRWQPATNEGRFLPVGSGHSFLLDGTLAWRF